MWDEPDPPPGDLDLRILNVAAAPADEPGALQIVLNTSRGDIRGLLHPVEGGANAVVCVGGAMGGLDGPAGRLYARLPALLAADQITVLRVDYRQQNELEECALDALAACSFLKGIGASGVVLVGHSFGGAVVIKAGELAPIVRGVVSMSPQLHGARGVDSLNRPLLLIHGMADDNAGTFPEQSERLYAAVQGLGGTVRFVYLPDEAHGYLAQQTIEHVVWEMDQWFNRYVKGGERKQ
jgi:dipeptidyl aminopeptidase/acylaminoacyl peptidase